MNRSDAAAIMETQRLFLREFRIGDAGPLYEMDRDPEVIRHLGEGLTSLKEAEDLMKNYSQYRRFGMGRWAVVRKRAPVFLGWCGLLYLPDTKDVDLGFRFLRKHWGRGYATESARASLGYGFAVLGLKKIVARASKENLASLRVLEKIGLCYTGDAYHDDRTWRLFEIEEARASEFGYTSP